MRLILAVLAAAYLLVAVSIVHADIKPPPDPIRVINVAPRAHAADYLYMSFDGCKNALLGVNPDNSDNDILRVKNTAPVKQQLGWGLSSPTRMLDGTIRAFYQYYYYGTSYTWEFRCRRLSSTNVDDWPIWQ